MLVLLSSSVIRQILMEQVNASYNIVVDLRLCKSTPRLDGPLVGGLVSQSPFTFHSQVKPASKE